MRLPPGRGALPPLKNVCCESCGFLAGRPYRGRGYARAATSVWAEALRREGRLPLYSTSWGNLASQRVAAGLGALQYGVDFSLT